MAETTTAPHESATALRNYYWLRAGVSIVWVLAAFVIGAGSPVIGGTLLVLYPAWDAIANARDAQANGGFRANAPQALNVWISSIVTVAVAATLLIDLHLVFGVIGAWAILSGLLQLIAGVRRWREYGAQWAMVLSGAQSMLAGGFFIYRATGDEALSAATLAPYAAFGAFYFLLSATALTLKGRRRRS
mgnify:CR=1 FL=1